MAVKPERIKAMLARERDAFAGRNPNSAKLADGAKNHWLRGVPMHWMVDWGTPFPLFIESAQGAELIDADGHAYVDFCLGDTGAMFGHSPPAISEALRREAARGFTTMLPSPDAAVVGALLADRFGLPYWQVTATASDANRAIIAWARAAAGRSKILVFNHCYHGAVPDVAVRLANGAAANDPALIGEVRDLTRHTKVVEFDDLAALAAALAPRDVACVLAEPVMTNVGMVPPEPGYLEAMQSLCKTHGTLFIADETHCISSGPGGYCRAHGLTPDGVVLGKPLAGGVPAGAYGVSAEFAALIGAYLAQRLPGHSGIGTTLSGSRLQLALMRTMLETYFTDATFEPLFALAEKLERGIAEVIARHKLPWHATRVGARVEFMCCEKPPKNGTEAARVIHQPIDIAIHHYLLNRGIVVTPFHNMLLISPATDETHVQSLIAALDDCARELST